MKIIRLFIIRILVIISLSVGIIINKLLHGSKELPMRWLLHYVVGTGKSMTVPTKIVEDGSSAILAVMPTFPKVGMECCVYSSTLYEGRGFANRPTLFYLVGGFTYQINKTESHLCFDGHGNRQRRYSIVIGGTDHYDWHAAEHDEDDTEAHYYTSSFPKILVAILATIFGKEYFPISGWPMGNPGISNKLWEDLSMVGAREFDSHFKCTVEFSQYEIFRRTQHCGLRYKNRMAELEEYDSSNYISREKRFGKKKPNLTCKRGYNTRYKYKNIHRSGVRERKRCSDEWYEQ